MLTDVMHWVVYEDEATAAIEADHFRYESAYLTLTKWTMVLMRPREMVVRRLPLMGLRPIRGVMADQFPADLG